MSLIALIAIGSVSVILVTALIFRKYYSARDNYKPNLSISIESNENESCSIKLLNEGTGTAIIKKIDFWDETVNQNQDTKKSIDQLFPFDKRCWMKNQTYDEEREYYLSGGDSLYFGKLNKESVIKKGKDFFKIKEDFDEKIKDIRIRVEYNDVYEKPQKPLLYKSFY